MKRIMLLLVLALPLLADGPLAQAANALSEPPFTAKGAFFALSVVDLESSARWYSEKFGLKIVMQAPKTKTVKFGGGCSCRRWATGRADPKR